MRELLLLALPGIPEIVPGSDLAETLIAAIGRSGKTLQAGDVIVVAQKVISKVEGRQCRLSDVQPSPRALDLAEKVDKDPRLVELILRESRDIVRFKPGVLIVEHRLGFVTAGAGIDQSNVPGGEDIVLLLPEDPDASARRLRRGMYEMCGVEVGVVINDSFGRAWRNGVIGCAIGVAGMPALIDMRGTPDREGRSLRVTQIAAADELAAAASLVMGQAAEGSPAVLARGFPYAGQTGAAADLVRPRAEDLFR